MKLNDLPVFFVFLCRRLFDVIASFVHLRKTRTLSCLESKKRKRETNWGGENPLVCFFFLYVEPTNKRERSYEEPMVRLVMTVFAVSTAVGAWYNTRYRYMLALYTGYRVAPKHNEMGLMALPSLRKSGGGLYQKVHSSSGRIPTVL